jgi:uncharacterized membrane protein
MWYYAIYNRQHGPVSEADMDRLIAQGFITAQTLVWREGMPDWQPAAQTELAAKLPPSVPGQELPPVVAPPDQQGAGGVYAQRSYGTRSQGYRSRPRSSGEEVPPTRFEIPAGTSARGLMGLASDLMSGRWGLGIGFCLIYGLIAVGIWMIPYIGWVISILVFGVLEVGALRFWLTYTRGGDAKIDQLFSAFPIYLKTLLTYLLMSAIITLASLVVAMPGFILMAIGFGQAGGMEEPNPLAVTGVSLAVVGSLVAQILVSLNLAPVFYILADEARVGVVESLQRSRALMRGNKWRLFRLQLLFTLLAIGCIFTLGIGLLWLVPYSRCSLTCFYESLLSGEKETA